MVNLRGCLKALPVFLVVGILCATVVDVAAADEQAHSMVILKKEPEGASPKTLKVKVGNTAIWINYDPNPVSIRFKTKIGIACREPVNFYADLFGFYETTGIPQGGIASLCFIYKGTYDYEVRRLAGKGEQRFEEVSAGQVIVE
jgi:hypothetical protein